MYGKRSDCWGSRLKVVRKSKSFFAKKTNQKPTSMFVVVGADFGVVPKDPKGKVVFRNSTSGGALRGSADMRYVAQTDFNGALESQDPQGAGRTLQRARRLEVEVSNHMAHQLAMATGWLGETAR